MLFASYERNNITSIIMEEASDEWKQETISRIA